jgi:hypothetical protein
MTEKTLRERIAEARVNAAKLNTLTDELNVKLLEVEKALIGFGLGVSAEIALPEGVLAIMSAGVEFRSDKKTKAFRALVAEHLGDIERLPAGSFKSSGTDVNTVLVTMQRAA